MRLVKTLSLLLALVLSIVVAAPSFGCPVCFGDSDAPIVKGLELSVLFLVGVTYSLILGGIAVFLLIRRRAQIAHNGSASHDLRGIG